MDNKEYKDYSLKNISTWIQDAISSGGATSEEIYDTILEAVKEEYYIYKNQTSQCYELLALLNGNGQSNKYMNHLNKVLTCDKDDPSPECKGAWNSFWEENYYPNEYKGSTVSSVQYTEEELNAMCDKAASDEEKEKCREYNLREAEYYNKRAELDLNPGPYQKYVGWTEVKESKFNEMFPGREKHKSNVKEQISRNDPDRIDYKDGLIYESPDGGKTVYSRKPGEIERTLVKQEEINKWVIPVEIDGPSGEYFVTLPDDLLKEVNLKEGDEVEWIENKDGSYILRRVNKIAHHPV